MIRVHTRGSVYLVDRVNQRWMRTGRQSVHDFDGEWVSGGFTIGEPGSSSFAHFDTHPDGATGRHTSTVLWVEDDGDATESLDRPRGESCGSCHRCLEGTSAGYILCHSCGSKRCPKANDHRHRCTASNAPGQTGSAYS